MVKEWMLGVRLPKDMHVALERAAKDDARSISNLVEKILREWLKAKGYLK